MIKKYPQAHLDKMRFCASTTYEAGVGVIYFPEYTLNSMDEVFNFSSSDPITQKMFDLFAEDEYLLMHEAMHVLCNDAINFERASFGSIVGASLISLILFAQVVQGEMSWQTQVKGSVFGAFVAYVALSYYSQFQEIRADGFANQNCDENALRAGICWFKRLDTVMNLENITVPESVQLILKFLQYHKHPLPQKRIDQASKALTLRFAA
jgi:Zn-dependent protease with chaperone function